MGPRRRVLLLAVLAAVLSLVLADPAGAHGAGGLTGLPLPRWQFAWAVGAVVVVAFFVIGATMRRPRLADAARGRALPGWTAPVSRAVTVALRLVGVLVYVVVVTAGLFGSQFPAANIAPIAVFVTFWVGIAFVSILLGDVWRVLSPFETLALVAAWARARSSGRPLTPAEADPAATHWPAAAVIAAFVWLELAYHSPTTPRILGWVGLAYGVGVLTTAARRGRGWLRTGEGFAVLFSLFGAIGPLTASAPHRLRVRPPFSGLARTAVRPGTLLLLCTVIGAAVFDGLFRTTFWADLTLDRVGWGYTAVNTVGLAWAVGVVAFGYLIATRLVAAVVDGDGDEVADRFALLLVPAAAAYTVAHYFSALVLEGQGFWFLISNPYGEGWDLFGTDDGTVDTGLVSATAIAWVQAVALAVGHAGAVLVAHDRAVTDHPPRAALAAQYVLLVLITGSAVAGVALLLGT